MSERPEFYAALAARRAALPVLDKPADPQRGHYVLCSRCKGKGDARYNHRNGDEYCYLCTGKGWRLVFTAEEQAIIDREHAWWGDAYAPSYKLRLDIERIARKGMEAAEGYVYERGVDDPRGEARRRSARRTARLATFWIREGLEMMNEEVAA